MIQRTDPAAPTIFRELGSREELRAGLRLRYEVYRGCRLRVFCPEDPASLDLDAYDLRARHFGLFRESGEGQLIGYVRLVTDESSPHAPTLREIAADSPTATKRISSSPTHRLPCLSYFPGMHQMVEVCEELASRGTPMVEPSRLVLLPQYQGVRLGLFLIRALTAYCLTSGHHRVLATCHPDHQPLYRSMGFEVAPGTSPSPVLGIQDFHCLLGRSDTIPTSLRSRLASMRRDWLASSAIRLPSASTRTRTAHPAPLHREEVQSCVSL